jgi:hypothetical protein
MEAHDESPKNPPAEPIPSDPTPSDLTLFEPSPFEPTLSDPTLRHVGTELRQPSSANTVPARQHPIHGLNPGIPQRRRHRSRNPGAADPGAADPSAADPGAADPGANDPGNVAGGNGTAQNGSTPSRGRIGGAHSTAPATRMTKRQDTIVAQPQAASSRLAPQDPAVRHPGRAVFGQQVVRRSHGPRRVSGSHAVRTHQPPDRQVSGPDRRLRRRGDQAAESHLCRRRHYLRPQQPLRRRPPTDGNTDPATDDRPPPCRHRPKLAECEAKDTAPAIGERRPTYAGRTPPPAPRTSPPRPQHQPSVLRKPSLFHWKPQLHQRKPSSPRRE